jgi:hypothetical protein
MLTCSQLRAYRVRSGIPRTHAITLECAELAIGGNVSTAIAHFEGVRRRRNTLSYDVAGRVSESEAKDALKHAGAFQETVESWLATNHPHLA